ncbi:MAG: ATP phosphoribosyltransferase regulatory subunit [Alphaproteobacteria bacterium]|nr:ATP phosphoribosyltransferase regulatory subunit [Alphaproteobacteria bacterium]
MSAWVLPDHLADVLPAEARRIEEMRRLWLDSARSYGYELVIPPMLEHLESLLSGTGSALDLQTFKLVDQLSGRSMGLRADTTPQVARIDAHLLNRSGLTRLCYCGPVLHTRPEGPFASREPLQLGAELYGHQGLEADLEILELALHGLARSGVQEVLVDLGDARIVSAILSDQDLSDAHLEALLSALAAKDASGLSALSGHLEAKSQQALHFLLRAYGDHSVLDEATVVLSDWPQAMQALADLRWLTQHLEQPVMFDLADARGYAYYSGIRFAIYTPQLHEALVRGGRYDEVGAVFGRRRAAVGFSLDLKALVGTVTPAAHHPAIRAVWSQDADWRYAVARLRERGETVICVLPGHENETDEFECDRELVTESGQWLVRLL